MEKKIVQLIANWFAIPELGAGYETYNVGKNDVTAIIEYRPRGDGDRWYYDVIFAGKGTKRIFNPNSVSFEK